MWETEQRKRMSIPKSDLQEIFHLSKITNLLCPGETAQVHSVHYDPPVIIKERIYGELPSQADKEKREQMVQKYCEMWIHIDNNRSDNFLLGGSQNLVYIDDLSLDYIWGWEQSLERLEWAIEKLPEPSKSQAKKHFERLDSVVRNYQEKLG